MSGTPPRHERLLGADLAGDFGSYRVDQLLGEGGVGMVFLAHRVADGLPVALKVLHSSTDERHAQRFSREARVVASLRHPGIVRLHDFGTDPNLEVTFLVMELVEGETLGALIARGPIAWPFALHLCRWLAVALGEAHTSGIVHRDVKPDNVILTESNGEIRPVLLDFGLARSADDRFEALTREGDLFGTPDYMSPEQARNPHVGPSTDIYALGTILFEMLTGRLPFVGSSGIGGLVLKMRQPAPTVNSVLPAELKVPDAVDALVSALLEIDPAGRVASADELVGRIEGQLDPTTNLFTLDETRDQTLTNWLASTRTFDSPNARARGALADRAPPAATQALTVVLGLLVGGGAIGALLFLWPDGDRPPSPIDQTTMVSPPAAAAAPEREESETPPAAPAVVARDAGSAGDSEPSDADAPTGTGRCDSQHAPGIHRRASMVEGREVVWYVYVPKSHGTSPSRVLIVTPRLHRDPRSAFERRGFIPIAERENLLLVTVQPIDVHDIEPDLEVPRTHAVLDELQANFCTNPRFIYAAGAGRGEALALRLAERTPLSAVAGSGYRLRNRRSVKKRIARASERPTPYLHIWAREDPTAPLGGGKTLCQPSGIISLDDQLSVYRQAHKCSKDSEEFAKSDAGECIVWACDAAPFGYCEANGGGEWPTEEPLAAGLCSGPRSTFDYSETIWTFFQEYGREVDE